MSRQPATDFATGASHSWSSSSSSSSSASLRRSPCRRSSASSTRRQDAEAKSNARNLVSHVEACRAASEDYTNCDTIAKLQGSGESTGLPLVDGAPVADGTVGVAAATKDSYTITAQSRNASSTFSIQRTSGGATSAAAPAAAAAAAAAPGSCKTSVICP